MTKNEQVANIISFLTIIFGEDIIMWNRIMQFSPDYLLEKFQRYVESKRIEYPWGLHPVMRSQCFQRYADMWHLELTEDTEL